MHKLAGWIVLLVSSCVAFAQPVPDKALRIVVPFGPGGGSDIFARLISPKLSESLRQPVVVENRPGAGGTLGADLVAKAPPDGNTLLLSDSGAYTISPSLYPNLPYAPKDLAPVINLALFGNVLVAPIRLQAGNVVELVALDKASPGRLSIASSGNGTSPHLSAELFKMATGLKLVHVPYKGSGPAIADVTGGQVDLVFTGYASVASLIKGGKVKALAVTTPARIAELPGTPTVAESGYPGFESYISQGVFAPAGTPREVVSRLNREIASALRHPEVAERMRQLSLEPHDNTPEQFGTWLVRQSELWARVIREAKVKVD
ncbi:MAG: tripartite tricarboxylate transporter substrate binding protein [Betaproteobacteria bacterium]|nr:tripartite tricarboxylate transporter substrate binding protein [Betaproteobacteria bacterium]